MKRSKAVEIIKLALSKWNGAYYDENLESYILSELESIGMKPPYGKHQTNYDIAMGSCPQWEPEND